MPSLIEQRAKAIGSLDPIQRLLSPFGAVKKGKKGANYRKGSLKDNLPEHWYPGLEADINIGKVKSIDDIPVAKLAREKDIERYQRAYPNQPVPEEVSTGENRPGAVKRLSQEVVGAYRDPLGTAERLQGSLAGKLGLTEDELKEKIGGVGSKLYEQIFGSEGKFITSPTYDTETQAHVDKVRQQSEEARQIQLDKLKGAQGKTGIENLFGPELEALGPSGRTALAGYLGSQFSSSLGGRGRYERGNSGSQGALVASLLAGLAAPKAKQYISNAPQDSLLGSLRGYLGLG